jgi:hypothetical protein
VVNGTFNLRVNPTESYEESGNFFVGNLGDGYLGNHVWRTTWSPATKPSAIASATLTFNTSRAASGLQIVVRGANADNAPANSDGASDAASSSTGKTGSVTVAAPASTATPLSIDVTTIVSAIVGRSGWTPGNSIKIYLFGDNATNGTFWQPNPVTGQGIGTLTIQWQDTAAPAASVPDAPTLVRNGNAYWACQEGDNAVMWNVPSSNGGSAITGYVWRIGSGSLTSVSPSTGTSQAFSNPVWTGGRVAGLPTGGSFQVAAVNEIGTGAFVSITLQQDCN